jgi:hypothetical protein
MTKRMVLLTAGLWLALYASQRVVRALFGLAHASVTGGAWAVWISMVLCTAVAAWLVGRWRGVADDRLIVMSLVTCLVAFAVWLATGSAVLTLPSVEWIAGLGEVVTVILTLMYALEAAAVSWLVAGASSDQPARSKDASA